MQVPSVPSHIDSCTCHGRPRSCGVGPLIPGNRTSVIHTLYDTPAELCQGPCSLSAVSVPLTAAVDSTAGSEPCWRTPAPAAVVFAVVGPHSVDEDVHSPLISGRSAPANVSASLQSVHYKDQRRKHCYQHNKYEIAPSFLLEICLKDLSKLQTAE